MRYAALVLLLMVSFTAASGEHIVTPNCRPSAPNRELYCIDEILRSNPAVDELKRINRNLEKLQESHDRMIHSLKARLDNVR
jgi:hypothetical protein